MQTRVDACRQNGAPMALRADGDSKYDHAVGIRDKLLLACPECGYNPKVDCRCPICQGSCKAKSFAPGESTSKLLVKTEAQRKRLAKRLAAKTRATFAAQTAVDPNTPLGRALGGANPQALNALPSTARAAMGLTSTSAHVGLAGNASGGEMSGRAPDATFQFVAPHDMPPAMFTANRRTGGLVLAGGPATAMATVNLPLRTLEPADRERLLDRARTNAAGLMLQEQSRPPTAPIAEQRAEAPSAAEAAAAQHAAQNPAAATAASWTILARAVEDMVMSTPSTGGLDTPAKQAKADEIRKASRAVRQRINDPDHLEHRQTTNTVQSALLQATSIVDNEHGTQRARLWSDLAGDLNLTAAELTPNKWGSRR
jgi:hypothetical protein